MATITLTIGTSKQYADLASAWAAIPADVVGSGNEYVLAFAKQAHALAGTVTLNGKTTSATNRIVITAEAGASFVDNPDVKSTPLWYDATKGAAITGSATSHRIVVDNPHVHIIGLQISNTTTGEYTLLAFSSNATGGVVDKCILDSAANGNSSRVLTLDAAVKARNSLLVYRSSNTATGCAPITGNNTASLLENLTIVRPSAFSGTKYAIRNTGTSWTIRNCVALNFTSFQQSSFTGSHNACTGTVDYGTNNLALLVAADAVIAPDSDLRLKTGSPLIDAGTAVDSSNATTITGSRTQSTATDIGAWEVPVVADSMTLSGPSTAHLGYPITITVTTNGSPGSTTTVTPSDNGGGGTFSPTSATISTTQSSATFQYTANTAGTKTITVTSNPALNAPAPLTIEASQKAPSGAVTSQPAPDGQSLTITFSTSDNPTGGMATLNPDPVDPNGAVATSGVLTLTTGAGSAAWTEIPPGNYVPEILLTNAGGSGLVSGLTTVSIVGIEGDPTGSGGTGTADTTAPTMTGTVSVSLVTHQGFTASWTAATDNSGVVAYEFSRDGGTTFVNIGNVTSYEVTDASASTTYPLQVRALDAANNRSNAISGSATTLAPPADTTAPTMSGTISVSNIGQTGYTASWTAGSDAVGVTGYEFSTDGGTSYIVLGNVLSHTVTNAQASTAYALRVRAVDAAGNKSTPIEGSVTTSAAPPVVTAPGAPTIGTAVAGNGFVDVYFTPPTSDGGSPITNYLATLSTGETQTGTTSPIRVSATNGTARTASVQAINSAGTSAPSAQSNAVTPTAGTTAPGEFIPSAARTIVVGAVNKSMTAPTPGFWDMANPKKPVGIKDPDSIIDITFDWSEVLADVQSSIATIQFLLGGGLSIGEAIVAGSKATIFLDVNPKGNNVPTVISITCRMTTTSNPARSEDRTVYVNIEEQ